MLHPEAISIAFAAENDSRPEVLQVCALLSAEIANIREWLRLKLATGRYAQCFLIELALCSITRSVSVHSVYDEIGKLEGTDDRPSITKEPQEMLHQLRGLWHKHYFETSHLAKNLLNEFRRMQSDGAFESMNESFIGKSASEFVGRLAHASVVGGFERRAEDRRITGEFIVYEKQPTGSNYYITLGKHGEWDAIRARVDRYKEIDRRVSPLGCTTRVCGVST